MIKPVSATLIASIAGISQPAAAEQVARATSPNGRIEVVVSLDRDGRSTYAVNRDGRPVIGDSGLGFMFTDAPTLERGLAAVQIRRDRSDTRWTQPWGEWATIRDNHSELAVTFREAKNLHRQMTVTFRLFDDGVGFRYTLPQQANMTVANIEDELTQFVFAEPGKAWWKPALERKRDEYLYAVTPLEEVGVAQTVLTIKSVSGLHLAVHEAGLVDYSAMNLRHVQGRTFRADLTPGSTGAKVTHKGGFSTPWRTIAIADDAPRLYEASRLTLNLNEPNALGDVSGWIHPCKYVGIWWTMITGEKSRVPGPNFALSDDIVRRTVDFAAANRIPGVLVEGWNVGWGSDWMGNGARMNFARPVDGLDLAALAAYARTRNVRLIGHHETAGAVSNYESQIERAFAFATKLGEQVVKTGYVADAGQIERVDLDGSQHREWHEGQWMVNHHARVLALAARHHLSINSHEPVKDTGLRRTWPNWLTREDGRGMEYNARENDKNPANHEATLVFTQLLGGPMDFTPGLLSLTGSNGLPIQSTTAKQLALYVALYSPLAMLADTPENYAKYPQGLDFIRVVPTDWADTRVLNGEVGEYATIARKDRKSDDWYLGAVGDDRERRLNVSLNFLDAGRTYVATIYRDGPGADFRTGGRHALAIERRTVRRGDRLELVLAPGGGQAIRFEKAR